MQKLEFLFSFFLSLNLALAIDLTSLSYPQIFSVLGGTSSQTYYLAVSNAGDIDKDGKDDLIIGGYANGQAQESAILIYGTSTLDSVHIGFLTLTLNPPSAGMIITKSNTADGLGSMLSGAGDINGDGYADFMIGAFRQTTFQGEVAVIYGGPRSSLPSNLDPRTLTPTSTGFIISRTEAWSYLGSSVSKAGRINDDTYDDLVVGMSGFNNNRGAAIIVYGGSKATRSHIRVEGGAATLNPSDAGFSILGNAAGDSFGSSVSNIGDINKDGYDDILVGASGKDTGKGAAYVIYGSQSPINIDLMSQPLNSATTGFTILGNAPGDLFGCSVSSAGDINGDRIPDIIVGACGKDSSKGAAYIIYGRQTPADIDLSSETLVPATTGFMVKGRTSGNQVGYQVQSVGDLNNDGYSEVMIGTRFQQAVHVIYGRKPESLSDVDIEIVTLDPATTGFTITGTSAGTFGVYIGAGDFNGDDKTDLFVGSTGKFANQPVGYVIDLTKMCSANCDSCSLPSTCEVCNTNYGVVSDTLQCRECEMIGEYYANHKCNACTPHCDTCSDLSSCQTCSQGYGRRGSQCVVCPQERMYFSSGDCLSCIEGCLQCKDGSTCRVCAENYMMSDWNTCVEKKEDSKTESSSSAFEGASIIGSSLTSGSSLSLNFGLVAKILRNVKYLDIPVSPELLETFFSWKVASGFLSAPKSWSSGSDSEYLPMVFSRYDLQPVFLINYWKILMMTLIGLTIFVIFKGLEMSLTKGRWGTIARAVNIAASNFALTQFYSNFDDVVFYLIIDLRSSNFDTFLQIASFMLGVILVIVGIAVIGFHMWLLWKYQNLKRNPSNVLFEAFQLKYENINLFFKDFKDMALLTQSYMLINVVRCVVSSLIFALLFEYPLLQIILLLVLNITMIIFLLLKRSFKDVLNTCGQLFCEFVLLVANICMLVMCIFDTANSQPLDKIEKLSKCVIILNIILLVGCVVFLFLSIVKIFYGVYQEKKMAKNNKTIEISLPKNNLNNKLGELRLSHPERIQFEKENNNKFEESQWETSQQSSNVHKMYKKWSLADSSGITYHRNTSLNDSKNYNNEASQGNLNSSMVYGNQVEDFGNTSGLNLVPPSHFAASPQRVALKPKRGRIKMPEGTTLKGYVDYQKRLTGGNLQQPKSDEDMRGIGNQIEYPQKVNSNDLRRYFQRRKTQIEGDIVVQKMRE